MARRAIWKGVVSFENIHVPVKLYAAVENRSIPFHMLHDRDRVRLRQQMVCSKDNEPVPDDEIVKGLEVDDETYVVVGEEELAELEPEANRTIEVVSFVTPEEVDPRYFDRPYHLGPDGDERGYASLAKALAASDKLGICTWSFRKRFYNGALRSAGGVLVVLTLRTAEEVLDAGNLNLHEQSLSQKERKTAKHLVHELSEQFDPAKYHDEFQKQLQELVDTKAKGGKVMKRTVEKPEPTPSDALVEQLEASLKELEGAK